MTLALTAPPFTFGSKRFDKQVALNFSRRNLAHHSFSLQSSSLHHPVYSVKVSSAGKHIENLTYLPLKEFPWKKAKTLVEERLIVLGKNALKWSVIALLISSFISDALIAVSVNRELLVPAGLFIGLMLATFFKESYQELFESGPMGGGHDTQQLWSIGLFFVALRFLYLWFRLPGWVLLSHIGNGGLMQILWLAKDEKKAERLQNQEEMDALQHTED